MLTPKQEMTALEVLLENADSSRVICSPHQNLGQRTGKDVGDISMWNATVSRASNMAERGRYFYWNEPEWHIREDVIRARIDELVAAEKPESPAMLSAKDKARRLLQILQTCNTDIHGAVMVPEYRKSNGRRRREAYGFRRNEIDVTSISDPVLWYAYNNASEFAGLVGWCQIIEELTGVDLAVKSKELAPRKEDAVRTLREFIGEEAGSACAHWQPKLGKTKTDVMPAPKRGVLWAEDRNLVAEIQQDGSIKIYNAHLTSQCLEPELSFSSDTSPNGEWKVTDGKLVRTEPT